MSKLKSGKLVTIPLVLKRGGELSITFWDREYEWQETPLWIRLPDSLIEYDPNTELHAIVDVTIPEWLALDRGLI